MSTMPLVLEDFDIPVAGRNLIEVSRLEEAKLEAFEKGYADGWEDAAAAATDDQLRIGAELARNLQGLSFTYVEARSHVLRALEPLLHDMVAKVLPLAARASLGAILAETLLPMTRDLADAPVRIEINPAVRQVVAPLFQNTGFPVEIVDEPTLGEGQAYLRLGEAARSVDLDGVIAAIAGAVSGYFTNQSEVRKHG